MNLKKSFGLSCTFVGTLIGAGFASGKEIALYFGNDNIFSPILAGFLCSFFAFIFLEIGRISKGNPNQFIFGRAAYIADMFLIIANLIVFFAMVAGSNFLTESAIGWSGGAILAITSLLVIIKGRESIKLLNTLVVPMILIIILVLFALKKPTFAVGNFNFISPITYAGMNIISGGFFVSKLSSKTNIKENLLTSILIFVMLTVLISAIYFLVKSDIASPMPILAIATSLNLTYFGTLVVLLAIFTTMVSSLTIVVENHIQLAPILIVVGIMVSMLSFDILVDFTYPVIGFFGSIMCLIAIFRYFTYKFVPNKSQVNISIRH